MTSEDGRASLSHEYGFYAASSTNLRIDPDETDQYVELYLKRDIATFVEGMTHVIEYDAYLAVQYSSRMINPQTIEISISQPCIEKEADSLTPEPLKLHAKEVDEVCLSDSRKRVNLGALKTRNRVGSQHIMDSRWVIRSKRMPDGSLIIQS